MPSYILKNFERLFFDHTFRFKLRGWLFSRNPWNWVIGNLIKIRVKLLNCLPVPSHKVRHCSICGWSGREFYPLLSLTSCRERAICPSCGSLERHRALISLLDTRRLIGEGRHCLEVGPSKFVRNYIVQHKARYTSIDLGELSSNLIMRVENLAFKNASFDFIFCLHVLEYVFPWQKAIDELYRVLRSGGTLFLSENLAFEKTATIKFDARELIHGTPIQKFGQDLPETLIKKGFEVESYDYLSYYDARGDWIFICEKK